MTKEEIGAFRAIEDYPTMQSNRQRIVSLLTNTEGRTMEDMQKLTSLAAGVILADGLRLLDMEPLQTAINTIVANAIAAQQEK